MTSGSQSGLGLNILLFVPFTTSAKGNLDITVDWTTATDSIQLFLSANSCTLDQINGATCTYLAEAPPTSVKPRILTVPGVAAGAYTLYIGNRGPNQESVSWQVGLTTGGTASSATVQTVRPSPLGRWEQALGH